MSPHRSIGCFSLYLAEHGAVALMLPVSASPAQPAGAMLAPLLSCCDQVRGYSFHGTCG